MSRFVTKDSRIGLDEKMIEGLLKHVGAKQSIVMGGQTVTRAQMIEIFREAIALAKKSKVQRVLWLDAVEQERAHAAKNKALRDGLVAWLRVMFDAAKLDAFGLAPPKTRRKLTTEEKKAMVEKMRATRAARRPRDA